MKETWNERYAAGKYASAEPHKLLIELAGKITPGKALDLACGTGRNAIFLAENGWKVIAVDSSQIGIKIAKERAREKCVAGAIDFRLADLETGEFLIEPNYFDLICDFYYLQRDLFKAMKTGVKTGGIVTAAIHIYGAGEESGEFLLREGELLQYFEEFEILRYHETHLTDADSGEHHRRTAEITAKKAKTIKF